MSRPSGIAAANSALLAVLKGEAERHILEPLRKHGWNVAIDYEAPTGVYLRISADRAGHAHCVALLSSSATDNAVYRTLSQQVEHIYFRGEPYHLESFAYGIDKPVGPLQEFPAHLLKWNRDSSEGKFSPVYDEAAHTTAKPPAYRALLSEEPIEAIWLRLRQLQSVTLARKLVKSRAEQSGVTLDDEIYAGKAEGIAYTLRNASDYFNVQDARNVSQRVLNLYYGTLSFASAEMLSLPTGPRTLAEIEKSTIQGHGLYTVDGALGDMEHLAVGAITQGFFPAWLNAIGTPPPTLPSKKPRAHSDLDGLPQGSWLSLEQLFASIPEIGDLFSDIFESKPRWATPVFDQDANVRTYRSGAAGRSYILLLDDSARMTSADIAELPGPISEIAPIQNERASGRVFRAAIDHEGLDVWWKALKLHRSPFERSALIRPIFGTVGEYRAICLVLLYALSIIVRYRPSLWRRVQDGDLDHMRALVEAFLVVAGRVLPEQFLEKISGQRVSAHQPGSFFA